MRVMWVCGAILFAVAELPAKTYVIFRYDDFSADPNGVRTPLREQLWQGEQKVDAIFAKYHFPYVLGVVPGSVAVNEYPGWVGGAEFSVEQDSEKVLWLRRAVQEGRVEVAQHGFCHQRNTAKGHNIGEFREISYEQQLRFLRKGKAVLTQALEGREPLVFIPPFNALDSNTAKALRQEKFSVLSADLTYCYASMNGLNILPLTLGLRDIENLSDSDLLSLPEGSILTVIYHPVDLTIFPDSIERGTAGRYFGTERLDRLLLRLSRLSTIEVTTPLRLLQEGQDLSWHRYWKACKIEHIYHFWNKILPKQICPNATRIHMYLTSDQYVPLLRLAIVEHCGLILLVLAAGWAAYVLYSKAGLPGRVRWIGFLMIAIIMICIAVEADSLGRGFRMTIKGTLPGLAATGVILAMLYDKWNGPVSPEVKAKLLPEFQRSRWKVFSLMGLCMILSFVIHFHFKIHGFGEMDACEMGNIALQLHQTSTMYEYSYRIRTSILYIQFLKTMLDYGLSPTALPDFMNDVNVLAGALLLPWLYFLWRRLADIRVVIAAMILLSFTPAFWQGNIYGMPHIPALLFFVISLNLFYYYMYVQGLARYLFYLLAIVFGVLTVGFKADLMLGFGMYFVLLFRRSGLRASRCLACFWPIAIPVLFVMIYPQMMYPDLTGFAKFSKAWNTSFPFTFHALSDAKNLAATICSVGPVMFFTSLVLMLIGIWRKVCPTILLSAVFWALPLAAFWGLRMGNSARHMMMVMIVVLFYATVVLNSLCKSNVKFFSMVLSLIVLNYFLCPDSLLARTYRPSSRIFQSPAALQEKITRWHRLGMQFAESCAAQKMIIGNDCIYYAFWESMCRQKKFQIIESPRAFRYREHNQIRLVRGGCPVDGIMTEAWRGSIISGNPDWEIWEFVSTDNNTNFDLLLLHRPAVP